MKSHRNENGKRFKKAQRDEHREACALLRKTKSTNFVQLIDTALRQKIAIVENGKRKRVTVFDAISRKLWAKKMAGDRRASAVRRAYEKFAIELSPKRKRTTILIGGLPSPDELPVDLEDEQNG